MAARKAKGRGGLWMAKARASMERRGTVGSFGKATPAKIRQGLAKGGAQAKKAGFAKAALTVAKRRRARRPIGQRSRGRG